MPRSQIDSAVLAPDGSQIVVTGPLTAGPQDAGVVVLQIHVVLVQPDAYAHGPGTEGGGRAGGLGWTANAKTDGSIFTKGDQALASGLIVYVELGDAGDVPLPQTFSWSEEVTID